MPAINFKKRFDYLIESKIKRSTIRPQRKRPFMAGDTLYLYSRQRTKSCKKLREVKCLSVDRIEIGENDIYVNGTILDEKEREALANSDGFSAQDGFFLFFREEYDLPFKGILIAW